MADTTPQTPEEWLPILAKRMDYRMPRIRLLKRYVDGDAPLPEAGRNVRASWQKFQKESRTNWGLMIREAVANRIVPNGIKVGGSTTSPAAVRAQLIWRNNRMDSVFKDWVRFGVTFAESYMTVWSGDPGGTPVITADSPETMCISADPLQPWRVRAGLRVWRDEDAEKDYALVWIDGSRQKFSRDCYTAGAKRRMIRQISGGWDPDGEPVPTSGPPPIVVYNNPDYLGEFETHIDLINRINNGILYRRVIEAMQAFRQRALRSKEGTTGLQQKDASGNDIDWSKILEPAPGCLWDLPPGIDIWESQQTDTRPLLDGSKDDVRQLSSASSTPLPMLMPDSANQTAAGATATTEAFLSKCADRCQEAQVGGVAILVEALQLDGTDLGDTTLDLSFEPVERVSLVEKMTAAAQAKLAGMPTKTIWRDVLGWSPEEIAQADQDAADEALTALLAAPPPTNTPPPNTNDAAPKPAVANAAG